MAMVDETSPISSQSDPSPIFGQSIKPGQKRPSGSNDSGVDAEDGPDLKRPNTAIVQGTVGLAVTSQQVMVPDSMVGLIIGRGGEQISRMQAESGCNIQVSQDSQGTGLRLCTLTGTNEAITTARGLIEQMITNENNKTEPGAVSGGAMHEMMVPGNLVARIIGKGGEVIKALQEETGAKIIVIQESRAVAEQKPLRISGTAETVEAARQRVEQVIAQEQHKVVGPRPGGQHAARDDGRRGWPTYESDVTEVISVPSSKVGLVMGKGGETIRQICTESGAHCQVDKNAGGGVKDKNIVIKGRAEAVRRAKEMIADRVGGDGFSGQQGYYTTSTFGNGGFSHLSPQPDYSTQWADYYRSLGMVREAEIIEQQSFGRASGHQPSQAAQAVSDYSAQWAEYYRSVGKIQEAEAIEAQIREKQTTTSNPLGAPGQQQFVYGRHV